MTREIPPPCDFHPHETVLELDLVLPSDVRVIQQTVSLIQRMELALWEALTNAMVHGNGNSADKGVRVGVGVLNDGNLLIVVNETGSGFDPEHLPDPCTAENRLRSHGWGIFLMKHMVEEVEFHFDAGTEVRILVRRSPQCKPALSARRH